MPKATTTLTTLISECRDEVMDSSNKYWDDTAFTGAINRATKVILDDILYYKAYILGDYLIANVTIPLVASEESYNWATAISGASKTFYQFIKAMWKDAQAHVVNHLNWEFVIRELINSDTTEPFMTFSTNGTFLLRPKPPQADASNFKFWFCQQPATMSSGTHTPDIDETLMRLYPHAVGRRYWRLRGRQDLWTMQNTEYEILKRRLIKPFGGSRILEVKSTIKD